MSLLPGSLSLSSSAPTFVTFGPIFPQRSSCMHVVRFSRSNHSTAAGKRSVLAAPPRPRSTATSLGA
jgi:hypothetical protein